MVPERVLVAPAAPESGNSCEKNAAEREFFTVNSAQRLLDDVYT